MKACLQVTCGGLALVVAALVGAVLRLSSVPPGVEIRLDAAADRFLLGVSVPPRLAPHQVEEYRRNGVVLVRGLLSPDEAGRLREAAGRANARLFSVFSLFPSRYTRIMFDLWRTSPEIASLALQALPGTVSQLMGSPQPPPGRPGRGRGDSDSAEAVATAAQEAEAEAAGNATAAIAPFRLLRDSFFEYAPSKEGCGWHVDDASFWPSAEDTAGPTVWITLDPLSAEEGGGLAVLDRAAFRRAEPAGLTEAQCRSAIAGATCDMAKLSPECHAKMEASKLEFDMAPGDALVWDRWTFHRGVAGTDAMPRDAIKQRYSVRYVPHGATAFGAVHRSVGQGEVFESPYYPQVWPELIESEMKALERGLDQDITLLGVVQFRSKRFAKRVAPFLFPDDDDASTVFSKKPTLSPVTSPNPDDAKAAS